ncbi:unnamed protein product, partial [Polarella glacialis]
MAAMVFDPAGCLPDELVALLFKYGFDSTLKIAGSYDSEEEAKSLLETLHAPASQVDAWTEALVDWAGPGQLAAERLQDRSANIPFWVKAEQQDRRKQASLLQPQELMTAVLDQCVQKGVWRTKRQKKMGEVEGLDARAEVECLERGRWLDLIIALITEA